MKRMSTLVDNERGSLLVIAMIILMLLTLIGIAITTTASLELQIAANDRLHKTAFYVADGGNEIGAEVLEQNLGCAGGFSDALGGGQRNVGLVRVTDLTLWENVESDVKDASGNWILPSDGDRHLFFPESFGGNNPHTNVKMGGDTKLSTGNAIQMVSGYEGKGKGAAAGGAYIIYDMLSQHLGEANSQSIIHVQWRHVIGQEGGCSY